MRKVKVMITGMQGAGKTTVAEILFNTLMVGGFHSVTLKEEECEQRVFKGALSKQNGDLDVIIETRCSSR